MAEAIGYAILGRIGENLVDPIRRQFRYLFCFNSNLQNLQTQLDKVKVTRDGVQLGVDEARNNVRTIGPQVEKWLNDVEKNTAEAEATSIECKAKVEEGCLKGWCFCRYSLSRKAVKKTQDLVDLQAEGVNYTQLSFNPPPTSTNPIPTTELFKGFESRRLTMDEIIKNLENDEIDLIGICGMAGIGKTTMVKEVANKIRENNKFHDISFVVVKQQLDMIQIQKDIAKTLGIKLEQDNLADLLRQRLSAGKDNKRILLILDDVWEQFNFNDVGIPLVSGSGCKILYTSRNRDMWNDVRTKKEIHIGLLREEEAWQLFREKAGDSADDPELQPIAKQIVNECGRLPLPLVTIGSVLNNSIKHKWEDMLLRLQMPHSISSSSEEVYKSLELIYTHLEDDEAKHLFLLCCLVEEDYDIPIEDLARYGMGLSLFEGINDLEKIRNRVFDLVDHLKSHHLLLDGKRDECVEVHDVVRDVGISIASKDKEKRTLVSHGVISEWPKKSTYEDYTSISLVISKEIAELPEGLRCPKLELLLLVGKNIISPPSIFLKGSEHNKKIPDNFFEEMGELKVLELRSLDIPLMPSSLGFLRNLQTLCVYSCMVNNIFVIGELLSLEILTFRDSDIRELPEEIGRLINLRLLDLTGCCYLNKIPSGVISGLVRLEELYMIDCNKFKWEGAELYVIDVDEVKWEREEKNARLIEFESLSNLEKEGNEEGRNASLRELESLSNLNILEIIIEDAALLTRIPLFSQLKKYTIILDNDDYCWPTRFQKNFKLNHADTSIPSESGYLKNTELVRIEGGEGSKEVVHELVREGVEGLQHVKVLSINECDTLECLANTMDWVKQPNTADPIVFPILKSLYLSALPNLREICRSQLPVGSFGKLSFMCLENLPSLTSFCRGIDEIEFPQLKELRLKNLPKLNCLFPNYKKSNMSSDSNKNCNAAFLSLFPQKAAFPSLEVLELSCLDNLEGLGYDPLSVQYFSKLIKVRIRHFEELLNVIPSQLFAGLQNLEELTVEDCTSLEKVFKLEGVDFEERDSKMLPSLKSLKLKNLPKLNHIPKGDSIGFMYIPQLSILHVHDLDSLKYIFSPAMIKSIPQLQELDIMRCKLMSRIVAEENGQGGSSVDKIEFPQLKILRLYDMPNLVSFFPKVIDVVAASNDSLQSPMQPISKQKIAFPSLEVLELKHLDKLEGLRHDTIGIMCIPLLSSLHVHDCDRLRYLFSPAMMKGILHLKEMKIMRCKMMSRIFAEENEQGEISVDRFEFPQLKILQFCDLPNLVSFFPKEVSTMATSSPAHPLFNQKIAFPSLEVLELKHLHKLEGLFIGIMYIPRLSILHVHDCDRLRYLFSPAMVRSILQLQESEIMRCKTMSRIVADEKGQGDKFEFPQLKILQLYDLPNLVSFFPEEVSTEATSSSAHPLFNQKIAFPSLEVLELKHVHKLEVLDIGIMYVPQLHILHVHDCDSLKYLFSPGMVMTIPQLQELEIMRCKIMTRIVAEENGHSETLVEKIEFPQLKILLLYYLPNLMGFFPKVVSTEATSNESLQSPVLPLFNENENVTFPSLEKLHVSDCGSFQNLFSPFMAKYLVHR